MQQIKLIQKYLAQLGLSADTSNVYVQLMKLGPSSALQITRVVSKPRTQVYRELETLQNHGLVSAEKMSYGTLFRALPLENIEGTLANREAETASMWRDLSSMSQLLQGIVGMKGEKAKVQHYYGLAGLKQVNWNLTKAKKEYRVFEARHLSQHLDPIFAKRCREKYIENGLTSYDLTNEKVHNKKDLEPVDLSRAKIRYIDPKILDIKFEMYIYNDVVTLLDYSGESQMALEIHHASLSAMMKQLFDSIWGRGIDVTLQ